MTGSGILMKTPGRRFYAAAGGKKSKLANWMCSSIYYPRCLISAGAHVIIIWRVNDGRFVQGSMFNDSVVIRSVIGWSQRALMKPGVIDKQFIKVQYKDSVYLR